MKWKKKLNTYSMLYTVIECFRISPKVLPSFNFHYSGETENNMSVKYFQRNRKEWSVCGEGAHFKKGD